MPTNVLLADRDTRGLPIGLESRSRSARRLSGLLKEHFRKCAMGTVLKLEGEETSSVYLVLSGWMCVSKSMSDGNRLIIDVVLPGNMIDPASADADVSAVETEALTEVTYAAVPRDRWMQAIQEDKELWDLLQRETGAAFARMSERMLRLGKGDAESTIAYELCELGLRATGLRLHEVKQFHIPLTQQKLGDLCGLSSVHICRTLRRLQRNGIIEVTDHMDIEVHDMDKLAAIAEVDLDALRQEIIPEASVGHPVSAA